MMWRPSSSGVLQCSLLAALSLGLVGHAAGADANPLVQGKGVRLMADTLASAGRQGAVKLDGVIWDCRGSRCTSSIVASAAAAPMPVCQSLMRAVGALRSFSVAQRPMTLAELKACNSAQRSGSTEARGALPAAAADQQVKRSTHHGERLVTAEDFGKSARLDPGVQVDRVEVKPLLRSTTPLTKTPASSAAPASQPGVAAPASFSPVAKRTPILTLTGTGLAEAPFSFTPVTARTATIMLTGTGASETIYRFSPVAVRAPLLALTGTGRSE